MSIIALKKTYLTIPQTSARSEERMTKSKSAHHASRGSTHGTHTMKKSTGIKSRNRSEEREKHSGKKSRKSSGYVDNEVCNKFPLKQHESGERPSSRSRSRSRSSRSFSTAKTSSTKSLGTPRMDDDYLESPTSYKSLKYSSNKRDRSPERIVIENKMVDDRGGACNGFFSCLSSRKIIILIIIYALIATGLGAFLLNRSWNLFNREKQIEKLEEQVELLDKETKELEAQVDRLEDQVTRLGNETDRLESINDNLKDTAHDLNETISNYEDANADINESVKIYQELNKELSGSLAEATAINDLLSDSVSALEVEVINLKNLEMNLTAIITIIEGENSDFKSVIADLEASNEESKEQIEQLKEGIIKLTQQNDELNTSNENLVSILTFLKQTGTDLNTTVDELTKFLGNEINQNAVLVLMSLEISYQNVYKYWTVPGIFEDLFGEKSWILDRNSPIGVNDYPKLMEYLKDHVSSEVCADISDFENFLVNDPIIGYNGGDPPVDISFRSMQSGVERYFASLMDYYFSFDDNGVSKHQWMEAEYDCRNLAEEQRFRWS